MTISSRFADYPHDNCYADIDDNTGMMTTTTTALVRWTQPLPRTTDMSMDMMSLATVTKVDPSLERGRIHRRGGLLCFSSEAERSAWLWAVEQYRVAEQIELGSLKGRSLETFERALTDGTQFAFTA